MRLRASPHTGILGKVLASEGFAPALASSCRAVRLSLNSVRLHPTLFNENRIEKACSVQENTLPSNLMSFKRGRRMRQATTPALLLVNPARRHAVFSCCVVVSCSRAAARVVGAPSAPALMSVHMHHQHAQTRTLDRHRQACSVRSNVDYRD